VHEESAVDTDTAGGRAGNTTLCKSPRHFYFFSILSISCGLFSAMSNNTFDSFSDPLVYVEICENFNFNLLLNIPNQQSHRIYQIF